MARILLTHTPDMLRNYYGPRALASLRELGEVQLNSGGVLDTDALIEAARGCDIVVSDRQTPGEARFFADARDVAAFLRVAVDIRNIDVGAASAAGVLVTRARPGFMTSVAELALGFLVDLARGISRASADYHAGRPPQVRMGRELAGATAGVIGYGAIGRHLAPMLAALGMRVLVTDPHVRVEEGGISQVDLDELLARADYVICLAVATAETENLIDARALARMRPQACFVNLSRGNLVDEAALLQALRAQRIAGAAMDVGRAADQMPSPELAALPNVIATPHIGGLTPQAVQAQAFDTVRQLDAIKRGEVPVGAVNAEAWTRRPHARV